TVTGMVAVFDVMAISGSSDARAMSSGVARATIPTMAGMVAALSGLLFSNQIERMAKRRVHELSDELEVE
ncbi:MAG: MotA/TolQ/ExbB proton channel family protein, partial [Oceanicaulis sp.]